jgi:NAD(P)-dependent dehydrogenase (short-subunit alcohol dehydrogenase family)
VPALKAHGGTAIVNTASIASLIAAPGMAAYVASKHGVGGLTKTAALDLIGHGIRVNAICPGFVDTPMLAGAIATPEARAAMGALAPIGRIASAEEVAQTALFLASDAASYMIGVLLSVDGGVVIQ